MSHIYLERHISYDHALQNLRTLSGSWLQHQMQLIILFIVLLTVFDFV